MDQQIRFRRGTLGRIAYATVGEGPALVFPAWWIGHLEQTWEHAPARRFFEALAQRHTVVRYDPLGTGLSERRRDDSHFNLATEVAILSEIVDELRSEAVSLFGFSSGGPVAGSFAAEQPARVKRLILYGTYATGSRIADAETGGRLPLMAREHWGLGSRVLASVFMPEAPASELRWFAEHQRAGADPELAGRLLALVYELDAASAYENIVAPCLVLHRRDDRTIPFACGVEAAGLVPRARFEALEGANHLPWLGNTGALLDAVAEFMRLGSYELEDEGAGPLGPVRLTPRETEILTLVGEGLIDAEIAERLVISPHTVHRHIANIRSKLDQPTRAGAAAAAARSGLI
jgi:pimeloyl-ACP methyl ester carboxylesterase/DNA-binding CsgD family transcriptional regulator